MAFQAPYVAEDVIERDAEALLGEYAHARGVGVKAPIPIEDIVEKHLKLHLEFDDLHWLLSIPRGDFDETDVFGAIWLDTGRIVIDESLDPDERPESEGRYRFTLLHTRAADIGGCTAVSSLWIEIRTPSLATLRNRPLFAGQAKRRSPRNGKRI